MNTTSDSLPDDIDALKAALLAERAARRELGSRLRRRGDGSHLKLLIAKMKRDRFGASAERGRKLLDQWRCSQEVETAAAEDEVTAATAMPGNTTVRPFTRAKPVRAPLPARLPRERVVLPSPTNCPCCGGTLSKLGETITETLESIPRSYKVIQTVREKFPAGPARRSHSRRPHSMSLPAAAPVRICGDDHARQIRRTSAAQPPERAVIS